jgi:hypothetical protein
LSEPLERRSFLVLEGQMDSYRKPLLVVRHVAGENLELRPWFVVVSDTRYHCATRPWLLLRSSAPGSELGGDQCSAA